MNMTLGSDIEFFAYNPRTEELVFPLNELTGTKKNPQPLGDDVYIQRDNLALEINTKPASKTEEFTTNVINAYKKTISFLETHYDDDIQLYDYPCVNVPGYWTRTPEGNEIGCDPDYNAWNEDLNPILSSDILGTARTCSGHIHIGHKELANADSATAFMFIRTLDLVVGSYLVSKIPDGRFEVQRRNFYGKAGAMRFKPYGVEWRVPSNSWVKHLMIRKLYPLINFCLERPDISKQILTTPAHKYFVQRMINEHNVKMADSIIKTIKDKFPIDLRFLGFTSSLSMQYHF